MITGMIVGVLGTLLVQRFKGPLMSLLKRTEKEIADTLEGK